MVRTQIQLTELQMRTLKSLARDEGVSLAELVRRSVDAYLRADPMSDQNDLKKRALEVVGKYASDRDDIGENHDRYLAEIFAQHEP